MDILNEKIKSIKTEKSTKIIPENIKKNVTILGVTGIYDPQPNLQSKTVTITENTTTTITPDSGYDGLDEVEVVTNVGGGGVPKIVDGMKLSYSTSIPNDLDTSEVTNMASMFMYCGQLTTIPQIDTSNVTNMSGMFSRCSSLTTIPQIDTSKVTNMSVMFDRCSSFGELPVLDTSEVTNMASMFNQCNHLVTVPVLNTSKVTSMSGMFENCSILSNESLNNILLMCANSIVTPAYNKTLTSIGLSATQKTTCQSLSNYQDFVNAGWSV